MRRIEVLPDTHLCTQHAREIEKFGGEFKLHSHQDWTSKAGSLKKNFGGVSTRKMRNHEAMRKLREGRRPAAGMQNLKYSGRIQEVNPTSPRSILSWQKMQRPFCRRH